MDGTDVNNADRSPGGNLIATGDDFGKVNLYKYPCSLTGGAPGSCFTGHTSHVTAVEWLSKDNIKCSSRSDDYLITCGGEDKCVFQWKCTGNESPGNPTKEIDSTSLMAALNVNGTGTSDLAFGFGDNESQSRTDRSGSDISDDNGTCVMFRAMASTLYCCCHIPRLVVH